MIVIDSDVVPNLAVSLAYNFATENSSHVVDIAFVVDGECVLVSFHVVANPEAKAEPKCNFLRAGAVLASVR